MSEGCEDFDYARSWPSHAKAVAAWAAAVLDGREMEFMEEGQTISGLYSVGYSAMWDLASGTEFAAAHVDLLEVAPGTWIITDALVWVDVDQD